MTPWKFSPERLPMYIFPGFLIGLELLLRASLSLDTQAFIGPSLASIGAAYIVPLTVGKDRHYDQAIEQVLQKYGLTARPRREVYFIAICWVSIFILTMLWAVTLYLSTKDPKLTWWIFPSQYYPGFFNFIWGVVLTEIREVI